MAVFAVALAILIALVIAPLAAVSYALGAILSATAGYAGMTVATMANARTTEAARLGGIPKALPLAFRGGAVMGFSVAGLGLLGLVPAPGFLAHLAYAMGTRESRPTVRFFDHHTR